MKFEEGDIVTHIEKGGLYKIKGLREKSHTMYSCEDIKPDDKEPTWHQRKGGGAYTTRFVNGFLGEIELIHKKYLKKMSEYEYENRYQ